MGYERVSEAIRACADELVAAGAPREVVERHLAPLEINVVQSIIDSQRDQLLLNFSHRSADLAERLGVDERTIRKWRKSALDRNARAGSCSAKVA